MGDRVIGIVVGVLLGIAIVAAFVFFGSRDTIDDPSISGGSETQTIETTVPDEQGPELPGESAP